MADVGKTKKKHKSHNKKKESKRAAAAVSGGDSPSNHLTNKTAAGFRNQNRTTNDPDGTY